MNSESETLSLEELGESQQKELKEIAAKAIESRVTGKKSEIKVTDIILKKKAGVFVTINRFGQLRGCIGYILPYYELWEATAKAAAEAAVSDPRFISIDKDEIGTLEIEISVLGELEQIEPKKPGVLDNLKIGLEGLVVTGHETSGILLPQVATEFGFSAMEFLQATCEKAGLSIDAWNDPGVSVYKFAAKIF